MEHLEVAVRFFECQSLRGLQDVVSLAQRLPSRGFLPAEPPSDPKPSRDIEALVRHWWKPKPGFRAEKPFAGRPQYEVFFHIIPVQTPEVLTTFSCSFYSLEHSTVEVGGLFDLDRQEQPSDPESYAQSLLEMAQSVYPDLSPSFGWVDENEAAGRWFEEAIAVKLKTIGWANFFGPVYAEKFGREFLMGLPGWKVQELPDGGVFHQLSQGILASDEQAVRQLQKQVVAYCRRAGLRVKCRAPYVLESLPPTQEGAGPDEGYGTDKEFGAYLEQILRTTLILKGGTRVKPIYIEWRLLTAKQREIALSSIKRAAIAEIRRHRSTGIRFEFNEIPDDLDRMMRDLVGRDNPDFTYVQVDM